MKRKIFMGLALALVLAAAVAAVYGFMEWNHFSPAEVRQFAFIQRLFLTSLWGVPLCLFLSLVSLETAVGTEAGGVILSGAAFLLALGAAAGFGAALSMENQWLLCGAVVLAWLFSAALEGRLKASGRTFAVTGLVMAGILTLLGTVFAVRALMAYDPSMPSYIYQENPGYQVLWAGLLPLGLFIFFGGLVGRVGFRKLLGYLSIYCLAVGIAEMILGAMEMGFPGIWPGGLAVALSLGLFQGHLGRGFEALMLGQALFFGIGTAAGVIYLIGVGGEANAGYGFFPCALMLAALSARQIWKEGRREDGLENAQASKACRQ